MWSQPGTWLDFRHSAADSRACLGIARSKWFARGTWLARGVWLAGGIWLARDVCPASGWFARATISRLVALALIGPVRLLV